MKRGQRYQEIQAKFDGRCARCKATVEAGQAVLWDAQEKKIYCLLCAADIASGGLFGAHSMAEYPD